MEWAGFMRTGRDQALRALRALRALPELERPAVAGPVPKAARARRRPRAVETCSAAR
jgi:hypothetical protein